MRTLILLVLVGVLVFLALDSAEKPARTFDGPVITHYNGWKVRMFGMTLPAEVFVLGLMAVILLVFPQHARQAGAAKPRAVAAKSRPAADDAEAMREVNTMLERMERRIESLETILLAPEARFGKPPDAADPDRRRNT